MGSGNHYPARTVGDAGQRASQAGGLAVGAASARRRRGRRPPTGPDIPDLCLSPLRCLHQSGRHRADVAPPAGGASALARVADFGRFRAGHAGRPDGLLCHHVVHPGPGVGDGGFPGRHVAGISIRGAADSGGLGHRAMDCLVDQSANRVFAAGFDARASDLSRADGAPDLAFLRDLCHRAGELAAAG